MIAVRLPDGREVSVQTDDPQEAARAGRRLLAREAILKSGAGGGKKETALGQGATKAVSGATLGLSDVLDGGINAGITGVKNLAMRATGETPTYGMGDAYAADRGLLKEREADHPVSSGAGGLLGSLAMPGGKQLASIATKGLPAVANAVKGVPVVGGLLKDLLASEALPAVATRGAVTAAPLGAVSGAANADPGQELEGARTGSEIAAVTGAAIPVAARGAGLAAKAVKVVGRDLVRAGSKASGLMGGPTLNVAKASGVRLTDALKADGASPADLRAIQNEWLRTGASSPTVMDLAAKLPSGGQNTVRLLTGAAMKGRGAGAAAKYADSVAGNLQDNAINRTRALTPDTRTLPQVEGEISDRISSASSVTPPAPGSGGAAVSGALNARRDTAHAAVNAAYNAAREAQGEAVLHPTASAAVRANVASAMQDFDPLSVPRVTREVGRINDIVQPGVPDLPPGINPARVRGAGPQPAPIRPIFDARARLTQLRNSSDPVEASAAGRGVHALDTSINDAVANGHVQGDPSAVEAWQQAIGQRRQMGQQFEGEDLIHKLTERERHGSGTALAVAPEDATNTILGRNGVSAKPDLFRDLSRVRDTLGADSPEWQALQSEAYHRMIGGEAGTEHFGQTWDRFARQNPELANLLSTPEQRAGLATSQGQISGAVNDRQALEAGRGILSTAPDQHAAEAGAQTPLARLGAARQIEESIGRPTEGSTGILNRLSTSTNTGRNLSHTFGEEGAQSYQDAIGNEVERLRNSRTIDPRSGSQTAPRLDALADLAPPARPTLSGIALGLINKVRQGATLTDAEREAVVHLGLSTPDSAQLDQFEPDPEKLVELLHRTGALSTMPLASVAARAGQ